MRQPEPTFEDASTVGDARLARRLADGEQVIGAIVSIGRSHRHPVWNIDARFHWVTDGMLLSGAKVDLSMLVDEQVDSRPVLVLARPFHRSTVGIGDVVAAIAEIYPDLVMPGPGRTEPLRNAAGRVANPRLVVQLNGSSVELHPGLRFRFRLTGPGVAEFQVLAEPIDCAVDPRSMALNERLQCRRWPASA